MVASVDVVTKRGWVLFSLMAVIWGIPYLLIRVAVRQLDPGVVVFGRTAPAALLMLIIVLRQGHFRLMIANMKWIIIFGVV